jgi:hypothetical protein
MAGQQIDALQQMFTDIQRNPKLFRRVWLYFVRGVIAKGSDPVKYCGAVGSEYAERDQ